MNHRQRTKIAAVLDSVVEARWDRLLRFPPGEGFAECEWVRVYGWVERPDGRADFVLADFYVPEGDGEPNYTMLTSSPGLSAALAERLFDGDHIDCERVEDVFGNLVARTTTARRSGA